VKTVMDLGFRKSGQFFDLMADISLSVVVFRCIPSLFGDVWGTEIVYCTSKSRPLSTT
jgi:hypothetical protein